nr:hypothetical protein [Tanacetum cinerariifolium]
EPASLSRDDRQGEAFPTISSLDAGQERENIAKTSAMPHESSSRVPSLDADKGTKIKDQDLEISGLKERVKSLEDKERRRAETTQEDAPITGGIKDIGEELGADKTASVSPVDVLPTAGVPIVNGSFPIVSAIFTTTNVVTQYTRRSNEVIAKHLSEYEQAEADLSVREKIELRSELVKYQDHHAKILKYQAHQSKPLSKKKQREFYISVLRCHAEWKTKHFRGKTFEQIKEKFILVWKQWEDFIPMTSKEESERVKRQGLKIDQGSSKRVEISKGVSKGVFEEDLKGMMHLQFDKEDLHQLWTLVKETFSIKQATRDKEKELWVELNRLLEPDFEDHLWTHHQAFMHDPLDLKLYDTFGVHHVSTKDQEIFMLIEKDYPLR